MDRCHHELVCGTAREVVDRRDVHCRPQAVSTEESGSCLDRTDEQRAFLVTSSTHQQTVEEEQKMYSLGVDSQSIEGL
jgi:hypothetical protein